MPPSRRGAPPPAQRTLIFFFAAGCAAMMRRDDIALYIHCQSDDMPRAAAPRASRIPMSFFMSMRNISPEYDDTSQCFFFSRERHFFHALHEASGFAESFAEIYRRHASMMLLKEPRFLMQPAAFESEAAPARDTRGDMMMPSAHRRRYDIGRY